MLRFWDEEETLISWKVHSKNFAKRDVTPFAKRDVTQNGTDNWTKDKRKAVNLVTYNGVFSVASRRILGTLVSDGVIGGPQEQNSGWGRLGAKPP